MILGKLKYIVLTAAFCTVLSGCGANGTTVTTSDRISAELSGTQETDPAEDSSDTQSQAAGKTESDEKNGTEDGSSSDASGSGLSDHDSDSTGSGEHIVLKDHVTGIKDFSVVAGQSPDVMAGISWDDTIGTVVCDSTQVDWDQEGTQDLVYVIAGMNKEIERETIKVTVLPDLDFHISGMEGAANVVMGSSFDAMDGITWDDTIESVTADTSELNTSEKGQYPVSYTLTSKEGQVQVDTRLVTVVGAGADAWDNSDGAENYSSVLDLGLWRLTTYMDTPADQGAYVGQTASGAPLVAGRTVAVSASTCARLGLHFGDRLLIDGHVFTLEDHGGSPMNDQLWVDIFVDNEADEYSERFNRYSEVYLLR